MGSRRKIKVPTKESEPERKYRENYEHISKFDPLFASLMRPPGRKKLRVCTKCRTNEFLSEGYHQRLCSSCRKENERVAKSQSDVIYTDEILHHQSNLQNEIED